MPNAILNKRCGGNVYPNVGANFVSASSQYLSITNANGPNLSPGTGNLSVEAWINPASVAADQGICGKGSFTNSAGDAPGWRMGVSAAAKAYFICGDNGDAVQASAIGATSLVAGVWYHVLFTADRAGSGTLYLNGVSDASMSLAAETATWNSTADFVIGTSKATGGGLSRFFNGVIDCAGVWQRLFSAGDIAASYNGGIGRALRNVGSRTSLIAWYDLDGLLTDPISGYNLTNNASVSFTGGKR